MRNVNAQHFKMDVSILVNCTCTTRCAQTAVITHDAAVTSGQVEGWVGRRGVGRRKGWAGGTADGGKVGWEDEQGGGLAARLWAGRRKGWMGRRTRGRVGKGKGWQLTGAGGRKAGMVGKREGVDSMDM